MISGVVFIGDLLRPDGNCRPGGKDRATLWLWNVLKRSVYLASGLSAEVLTTKNSPELRDWIGALRPPKHADAYWASVYHKVPDSTSLERLVVARLRERFCIGFEMPPWLIQILNALAVPYIDLHIHPVRFMDDLMFAARSSCRKTQRALLSMAVKESEVWVTASLREAMCQFISEARFPPNTLLVAGQRRYDSTQIVGGGFFDAARNAAEIHAFCGRFSAIILKPHPSDRLHSLLEVAAAAPTNVFGTVDDNIYRLMALPQISAVLTVNSSVAHEAPFFGKRVHALAPLPIRIAWQSRETDDTDDEAYASLSDIVLTPDFWRRVLAPHTSVSAADGMQLGAKPNRLRIAFDSFWNYQQIDTDRVPRPVGAGGAQQDG